MPDPVVYIQAMAAAAGASAIFVLALGWMRRPAGPTRIHVACILGFGLGLALGCRLLHLHLPWPPVNGLGRLLTVVFPAVIGIELLAGFPHFFRCLPSWRAWLLRAGLAAATGRILLHGSVYLDGSGREWSVWQADVALALCGVLLVTVWAFLSWLSQRSMRSSGSSIPLALSQATLCAGFAIMLAGYVAGGEAAMPAAAALVGVTAGASLIAARRGISRLREGDPMQELIGIGVVGLFGLLFIGRFFGGLTTGRALPLFLAPLLCWATEIPLLRRRNPWLVGTIRLVLVAIPLLFVLAAEKRDFDREMAPLLGAETVHTGMPRALRGDSAR